MLLKVRNLSKNFGDIVACADICLSLEEGQVFGLLGPNGAGKSTLLKMMLGLVKPSSGQAFIQGIAVDKTESRKNIGYLPELFRLYEWLSAYDLLSLYARFYSIPLRQERKAIEAALELVGLYGREKEKIQGYSKGMQQRLALAGAVLHKPVLLFLDEPTSALDPIGRREVRDIVKRLQNEGASIFLNSHLLGEVEMTCSHLGFIKNGRLIAQGRTEDFIQDSHELRIQADNIKAELISELDSEGKLIRYENEQLILKISTREEIPYIIDELVSRGVRIFDVNSASKSLEDIFLEMIREG